MAPISQTPPQKTGRNAAPALAACLSESQQVLQGVKRWQQTLATWQHQGKVSPEAFEDALIALCRSGALECTVWLLEPLYKAVTGEQANVKKLQAIITVFSPHTDWEA